MKYTLILALSIISISPAFAQDALVIPLSASDSAEVRMKYDNMKKAEKDWADEQDKIRKNYTVVSSGDKNASNYGADDFASITSTWITTASCDLNGFCKAPCGTDEECKKADKKAAEEEKKRSYYRIGWTEGIEFDSDFKYILPKKTPSITHQNYFNGWGTATE